MTETDRSRSVALGETRLLRTGDPTAETERSATKGSAARAPEPVLGVIVVFAESSESDARVSAELGHVFPLRKGDVFFVGKDAPTEVETSHGAKTTPAAVHLFPYANEYTHISRRHLTIEFVAPREASIRDFSTNGSTLVRAKLYLKKSAHVVSHEETIILGEDLSSSPTPADLERASRYEIRLLMPDATGDGKTTHR